MPKSAQENGVFDTQSGILNNYRLIPSREQAQDLSVEGIWHFLAVPSHSIPVLLWNGKAANFLTRLGDCIPRENTGPRKINPVRGVRNFLDKMGVCTITQYYRELSPWIASFRPEDLW